MNQKILSKILATTLAVLLTFTNFIMIVLYATNSYATSVDELENQKIVSNNENVEFDAYFKDGAGKKIHTSKQNMGDTAKLYLAINVKQGYLKNSKIEILGTNKETANFRIANTDKTLEKVENIDLDKNVITLKQLNAGTEVVLEVPITSINSEIFDLSNFSKINNITLTGSYVDNKGKTVNVTKTIKTRNEWENNIKAILEQETKTFIPYEVQDTKGTIVQTTIKTGIENNNIPVKQTKINVKVPVINNVKPEEVIVTANSTYATNNQSADKFNQENWNYNAETGTISIITKNEANENKVSWNKNAKDEYVITYIFKEKLENVKVEQTADVEIEAYSNVASSAKQTSTLNIEENQTKGSYVSATISSEEQLSKGALYTKSEKETIYNEKVNVSISYAKLIDKIVLENNIDNFINSKGEMSPLTISNINYAYYKTTNIAKADFEKILGSDGYIKILGASGEQIAIFTKDTIADEKGNYVHTYETETNQIKIETSKPIAEGKLQINHEKSLKGKTDYNKNQIADFEKLQLKVTSNVEYVGTTIETKETTKDISLIAPSTKVEAGVSASTLSTVVKNENVEFRAILKTNDISCDLYKNPVIEIVLPNYIEELTIKDVNLLFDNELKIKDYKAYKNDAGNIVIEVKLEGEQTTYSGDEITKGANIVINTDIKLKQLTPTKQDVMKVYVTNENATTYENQETANQETAKQRAVATKANTVPVKAYAETTLKAVAPVGMVTTNAISGYNDKNETVTSISGENKTGKLNVKGQAKIATVTMNIINNYNSTLKNVQILGRIPVSENKNIETNKDLGSNLNLKLKEAIQVQGIDASKVKIYYSENKAATKDLSNPANGWKLEVEDYAKTASYLIMLDNQEMKTGETLTASYKIDIPENIPYNQIAYETYGVYYDSIAKDGANAEKTIAPVIALATGAGPELEVKITSDAEGKQVEEGQLIKYTATVKNIGKTAVENVKLVGKVPEGTVYAYFKIEEGTRDNLIMEIDSSIKEYSENFESIAPGETKTVSYYTEVKKLRMLPDFPEGFEHTQGTTTKPEGAGNPGKEIPLKLEERELSAAAQASVQGIETVFKSNEIKNKVVQGFVKAELSTSFGSGKVLAGIGEEVKYFCIIQNINSKIKENVVVTCKLPDGVSFKNANNDGKYDKNSNTVTWNLRKIEGDASIEIVLDVTADDLPKGVNSKEAKTAMVIKTKDREIKTNEITLSIQKSALAVEQKVLTEGKVAVGDIIKYNILVKNIGASIESNIKVLDKLPEELLYQGAECVIDGQNYTSKLGNEEATVIISTLKAGQTADITINAKVEDFEGKEKQIKNTARILIEGANEIKSNEVTTTIVKTDDSKSDPSIDAPIEGRKKISGIAWLDANNDGKRDENESTLGGINVMLINSETGKIVTDLETGRNKIVETDEEGKYTFANLVSGKYMVVFLYDAGNYGLTTYKKDGVSQDKNSDVISMKVNLQGEVKIAAVSDKLELASASITNIDMGLIVNPQFDLKLDKVITKITLTDKKGTKTYNYKDSKFAKLDLSEKTINGSNIVIEYKIRVTNEGGVAGYAKKIVDYIPKDMKFSSELNKDWYTANNGNIYNSSLANTLIQPGETKELTLLLTKTMTNENTGLINNNAEIYESYNELGIKDIDSTTANNSQAEDDQSNADAMIGVKTGEVYVYIIITTISISILGIGIYLINKKVLRRI